ncbi:acyltransferase family protein [uncultured Kushneria sp.]|uniref:acyltransferase family protein n=1 Tax=uncultured Kushneria sp. TaxID=905033 RepID=UPI002607A119|nr:acyltransferase family protein [uncultured Kushneria sp.]
MSAIKGYRSDIDGLRAIAVLAVVAFHFDLSMPGGFIGVDVFFVLSGYLIGSQIYRSALQGTFSWKSFYAKRARRIMPALIAVLLVSYMAMLLLATPSELRTFGRDGVATLLSISNITLWRSIDYFNPTADLNPLLMTWSLAVEEQFYIIAPFLIMLLPRIRVRHRVMALAILIGLSLMLAAWGVYHKPSPTFYLLPTRAWELGAGVLLAILTAHRSPIHLRFLHTSLGIELRALLGLLLIIAPIMLYTRETPFPGLAALPPVLGTVLLLNTELSWINRRLLSCRPMRFFGLISYSLYLWHWPLISMTHMVLEKPPGLFLHVVLMVISIVLAWLSYRLIETPFRRSRSSETRSLVRYAAIMGVVTLMTGAAVAGHGFPQRWPADFVQMDHEASTYDPSCLAGYGDTRLDDSPQCMPDIGEASGAVALIGDSHAAAMAQGIRQRMATREEDLVVMTKSSCAFLSDISRPQTDHPDHFSECRRFNDQVLDYLINAPHIKTVVMTGYWQAGLEDPRASYRPDAEGPLPLSAQEYLQQGLERAIHRLNQAGKQVVLVRDVPLMDFSPVKRLATCSNAVRTLLNPHVQTTQHCDRVEPDAWQPAQKANTVIDRVAASQPHLKVVDPEHYLCRDQGCQITGQGHIFYVDYQHLTTHGAMVATQWFDAAVPLSSSQAFASQR